MIVWDIVFSKRATKIKRSTKAKSAETREQPNPPYHLSLLFVKSKSYHSESLSTAGWTGEKIKLNRPIKDKFLFLLIKTVHRLAFYNEEMSSSYYLTCTATLWKIYIRPLCFNSSPIRVFSDWTA